jgi:hypothetical protein
MPRIVISKQDDHDAVECELTGDYFELSSFTQQGGHLIVLGRLDFVACYAQHISRAPDVPVLKEQLAKALGENKVLGEGLSRVQGRCTDYLEENRTLKREVARLERMVSDLRDCGWK